MREILDILTKFKNKGIKIGLDSNEENLSIKGDLTGLTVADKGELKTSKQEIVTFLRKNAQQSATEIPLAVNTVNQFSLAPNQKGIWFNEKLEELGTAYINPAIYFLKLKNFDVDVFEKSLNHLSENHDVLRFVLREKMVNHFKLRKKHLTK